VKEFLSHHGIEFAERVVDQDPAALEELKEKTGARATPVVVVGGEAVVGFDRPRLEALLGIGR